MAVRHSRLVEGAGGRAHAAARGHDDVIAGAHAWLCAGGREGL
ncbi:MAG: hypothetical protein U9Q68_06525 [Euryarchaeota archaeon]|nr:hypothetical protein [Euryarchaeota archaeon]